MSDKYKSIYRLSRELSRHIIKWPVSRELGDDSVGVIGGAVYIVTTRIRSGWSKLRDLVL